MSDWRYDVLGLGNAIVDVIARAEDDFLIREKLHKGSMTLIDEARAHGLYDIMGAGTVISGGSAANTIVGVASLGGSARYIGKVREDALGLVFGHDLRATGVAYETAAASDGPSTGCCVITGASTNLTDAGTEDTDPLPRAVTNTV